MTESLRIDRDWDLVLIGCGKSKQPEPVRALDLYTGSLFRTHLRILRHLDETPRILSAAHGVVCGGAELAPYKLRVGDGRHRVAGCPCCLRLDAEARRRGLAPKARAAPQVELPPRREPWNDHVLRVVLTMAEAVLEGRGRCGLKVDAEQAALPVRRRAGDLYRWAFGPPREPAVLVLAGADYIDGWADRARAAGVRVDDPLRGYALTERRSFAREFVTTTPRWGAGDTPDKYGMTRHEQLFALVAEREQQRIPDEAADEEQEQMTLDFWAGGFYA